MTILKNTFLFLLILLNFYPVFAQKLFINEVMPSNATTVADEDGDNSDWIELYNADTSIISLKNFGLSDDESALFKWTFPKIFIAPHQFLLIFASGKNIRTIPIHWETIIDVADEWKYHVPTSEPTTNWRTIDFGDSNWLIGKSGFGYGDGDDSTDVGSSDPFQPSPMSIFIRKKFIINDLNQIVSAILHLDYDDGFVAYLNGVEITRANMGQVGTIPMFDQFATASHEAQMYQGGMPEKFVVASLHAIITMGENVLAIQVHNADLYSSDLTLIPFFTLQMNKIPSNARGPSPYLHFPVSPKLHTNFKINAIGETLILSDSSGTIIDKVTAGYIPPDVSFGRQPDGSSTWHFFGVPTPEACNDTQGYQDIAPAPRFSLPGGFYSGNILLSLSVNSPAASIRYTTDGTVPTDSSSLYLSPILLDSTTVVRACAFGQNLLPGHPMTQTYFIDQDFTIPVISLVTDPANFWDDDIGIYVYGKDADTLNYPYWGSNFWQDWERPIHIELYEPIGSQCFSIDAGVKIFGSWSRLYPQKSLAIFARSKYGYEAIDYQIFPDKPIIKFQAIILRNSGQDWGRTFFRDAMMQNLAKDTDLDIQAYRPAMVFLNGKIWGIHNIREKMNEHYLASNRSVDPDNIDYIERDSIIIQGDLQHYQNLLQFVTNHDLHLQENYEYVKTQVDVVNFMDYTQSVIYFANPDWPWNNVRCWRPKTLNGRWKWMLYDLDYGFHGGHLGHDANMFNEMLQHNNGTTVLFFKLLENETYQHNFINRFADHLNTTFKPERVVKIINQFKAGIETEMPHHIEKWKNSFQGPWWLGKSIDSMDEWYSNIQVAIDFAEHRAENVRRQIMKEFGLIDGGIGTINLDISPTDGGKIKINSQIIYSFPWNDIYFLQLPIQCIALPNPGYRFSNWVGVSPSDSTTITFSFYDGQKVIAKFEPDSNIFNTVVINEINYKSAATFDTEDWVELHNPGQYGVDISDWIFKESDDNHQFIIPNNTVLEPNGYLVLCRDKAAFGILFPQVENCLGNFNFGLSSNGELIRLYDSQGNLVDSLTFDEISPWPQEPDGVGYTLELIDPGLDNSLPENWKASLVIGGTPGEQNSVMTSVNNYSEHLPTTLMLYQNYPNPFNSQTTIRFSLPKSERVKLKIFNILGEEIKNLVDKKLAAGRHKILWDGTNKKGKKIRSGIYFCLFKTNSFQQVRKIILIE